MKIAFYAPMKPLSHPTPSGDQMIARDLHDFMVASGHEVFVLSEFQAPWFYHSASRSLKALASFTGACGKSLREKPDAFFTYHTYYKAPDVISPLASRLFGKPYVVYEAMYSLSPSKKFRTFAGYHLNRFALQTAAHVFSDKTIDTEGLLRLLPEERVTYLPPSISTETFKPDPTVRAEFRKRHGIGENEVLVSCAAMLRDERKTDGVRVAIRALSELRAEGLSFRFVHAGGGPNEPSVRALARERLGETGLLLGMVPRGQVREMMQASDIFAFPGIDEGFGLVYIEAQACENPVIAFDNGGVPDAVSRGRSGLLTPLMDIPAYKDALRRMIGDSDDRKKMGREARAYVLEKHDRQTNYSKVVRKLEELCHPKNASSRSLA